MTATLVHEPTDVRHRWITDWDPEDETFWARTGRRVARRNLIWSIVVEHFGFSVWLLWSAVAVSLPAAGFAFSVDQLFWLVAVPNLVGSVMRIPYTAAVARFGGRNWTAVSAALLLVPIGSMVWCVTHPGTPYWLFLVAAATAGFGGGNFASSMANISYFYPERSKGAALGVNAAGGNIGVAVVQFAVPLVVGFGIVYAPLLWLVPVLLAVACALLFMDNLAVARADLSAQLSVLRSRHTWVMSWLYIGTFGSFIGYSAALPLLIKSQFPESGGVFYAALGPLVGSLSRPVGGWLSDRVAPARVLTGAFAVVAVAAIVQSLTPALAPAGTAAFLVMAAALGAAAGAVFALVAQRAPAEQVGAVTGVVGAAGGLGGFVPPLVMGGIYGASGSYAWGPAGAGRRGRLRHDLQLQHPECAGQD